MFGRKSLRTLPMVARQDAISLPIVWEGKSENYATGIAIDGTLQVGLTLEVSDRMFCVSVVVMEEGADGPHEGELEQLCMEMNASLPSACFLLSERGGAYVVSRATFAAFAAGGPPPPGLIRNLIREAILNAGLIAPMVRLVLAGVPFNDAIKAGIHHFNENRHTPADLPAWVYPDGDAPIQGAALIDAFIATAEQKEWPWHRPRDTQVVVTGFGLPDVGPTPTFVDAPDASLYLSTYFPGDTSSYVAPERRPAVATLLNKILDLGVAFGFAVDMETGQIRSRSAVSFEGLVHRPTPALLEDLVFQSAGGIVSYYEPIGRVAFEGADPLPTLYAYETARREQYRESA